jgi:Peptidoglycan-binding protein, CsiV
MTHRFLSLLVCISLLPGVSSAQSGNAGDDELIPRYDVEVVIFKNVKVPTSREFVLPVSSPGETEEMFDLSSQTSVDRALEDGYEVLPANDFRLLDVVTRLVKSSRYELLLHAAWRQPGVDREQALPIWLKGGRIYGNEYTSIDSKIEWIDNSSQTDESVDGSVDESVDGSVDGQANGVGNTEVNSTAKAYEFDEQTLEAQELQLLEEQALEAQELQLLEEQGTQHHNGLYELEGKITIALSRYLHTYVDLVLRRPRLSADPVLNNAPEEAYLAAHAADTHILNNHPLREHRRMRSKNLHYIDNPEFGVLVLITPYEVPEGFVEAPIEADFEVETMITE